jgi:hypothetical protein
MSTYKFTLGASTYYFVADNAVKPKVANKQGNDAFRRINNEVARLFASKISTRNGLTIPHSTILNENFEVVVRPEVSQAKSRLEGVEFQRFALGDYTVVNVYTLEGKVYMGTRNSWGINNSKDLYEDITYGSAFDECLAAYGFTLESLPSGTYAFSNPKIHLMANSIAIYSFTRPSIINDDGVAVSFAFPVIRSPSPKFEEEDIDAVYANTSSTTVENVIEYYPALQQFHEIISEDRQEVYNALYFNRTRFRNADNRISLINCVLNFLCETKASTRKYANNNKLFNNNFMECRKYITYIARGIDNVTSDKYFGIAIPKYLLNAKGNARFNKRFHGFWKNVITNAYNNAQMKSLPTF